MARWPSIFEPLDNAADAVIATSRYGGVHVKGDILDSLDDGVGFLANAITVMGNDLCDAGYGPEICQPVYEAAEAVRSAGRKCGDARSALGSLLNMSVAALAASQRQAPHNTELNGSH